MSPSDPAGASDAGFQIARSGGPVRVEGPSSVAVSAVVPCFNRPGDLATLVGDLAALDRTGVDLRVVVVDNNSEPPIAVPSGASVEILRLRENTGGSGGYNGGIAHAIATHGGAGVDPEYIWLVDSDARVRPDTLRRLLEVMASDHGIVAAGAAVADPRTGRVFEVGGYVCRHSGRYIPASSGAAGLGGPVACDYVAACCALVRTDAIRVAGLMPDVFLNGDDVEWCIRLAQLTGGRVVAVPGAIALHPRFDRFQGWARYYHARNAYGAADALRLGCRARLLRTAIEVGRAVQQAAMGREDLARLHVLGLRDAVDRNIEGAAPEGTIRVRPFSPLSSLGETLHGLGVRVVGVYDELSLDVEPETLAAIAADMDAHGIEMASAARGSGLRALVRLFFGPERGAAIVPARGRPNSWWRARTTIQVCDGGFMIGPASMKDRVRSLACAGATLMRGGYYGLRLLVGRDRQRLAIPQVPPARSPRALTTGVVILSHNRWDALAKTLGGLVERLGVEPARIVVVDNASSDDTRARLVGAFPGVRLLAMAENAGVEAFNRGVEALDTDLVLILDDDACPDDGVLEKAAALMAARPDVGAVALHPVHPSTGVSEWPFATTSDEGPHERWPVMGCGNLVRRDLWARLGGYERSFWLYRNDVDMAMKILGTDRGVYFDPSWIVWHDSPAASSKSVRWHRLATRNWIWMSRRHGGALWGVVGSLAGWAWSHRLAGVRVGSHVATLRGAGEGVCVRPPGLNGFGGRAGYRRLLRLRFGVGRARAIGDGRGRRVLGR